MNQVRQERHLFRYDTVTWNKYPLPNGSTVLSKALMPSTFTYSRSGVSCPNWRYKIKNGLSATTAFTASMSSGSATVGRQFFDRYTLSGEFVEQAISQGYFNNPSPQPTGGSSDAANNLALRGIFGRIREERTSFQGGVFLGEMAETMRMLTSPAKALRTGVLNYLTGVQKRTRGVKKKTTARRIVSETWLEYSFGWVPLASDIREAAKAYHRHTALRSTRVSYRGKTETGSGDVTQAYMTQHPIIGFLKDVNQISVQYRVGLRYATTAASPNYALFERAGLTIDQFAPTLYNLAPWSFLLDYFTNIGDMIEAGATNTSDVTWVSKTVRSVRTRSWSGHADQARATKDFLSSRVVVTGDAGTWTGIGKSIVRSSAVLTVPSFTVEFPGRATKWLNIAALASSSRAISSRFSKL